MNHIVERVYLDDPELKPQTMVHHKARYKFAANKPRYALDLACGSGYGTEMIRKAGFDSTGIDIDLEAIEYAKKHYPKCRFLQMSISYIDPFKYELITCFEALEHLDYYDALSVLDQAKENLAPGGSFIISVPRDENPNHNKFHKSHWDFHILEDALESRFSIVETYGQDWDTGKIFRKGSNQDNDFYIFVCKP